MTHGVNHGLGQEALYYHGQKVQDHPYVFAMGSIWGDRTEAHNNWVVFPVELTEVPRRAGGLATMRQT
eukprot:7701500-Alexandrium_andersonii.AAC.1